MNKNFRALRSIWTSGSIKPFKAICLLFLLCSEPNAILAKQKPKRQEQLVYEHRAAVLHSKINQTAYIGMDTLFCSGKALAIAHRQVNINNQERYELLSFSDQHRALLIDSSQNAQQQVVYRYEFPTLGMYCTTIKKNNAITMASAVCKFQLMTEKGIDTTKAEMFLTLNGASAKAIPLTIDTSKIPYEKRFVLKRNTAAPLTYSEDQIAQDGQLLARWEENIVKGPQGDLLQLTIINSLGAEIATASRGKILNANNTYSWHILTQKDMKFHSTEIIAEGELGELLRFLIQKQYL